MSGDIARTEGILTMKLSTSTNLLFLRPDNSIYPIDQAMKTICRAGFTELDMNFYDWATTPGSPYLEADWNAWLELVVETAGLLGVHFPQSHAYFYDFADDRMDETERSFHEAHVMRSIQCAQAMGVETLVVTNGKTTCAMVYNREEKCYRFVEQIPEYISVEKDK